MPLSTVHLWTRDIQLSSDQREALEQKHKKAFEKGRVLAQQINHEKSKLIKSELMTLGKNEVDEINTRELFLIGVALYWAEGFKKDNRLGFANSDPEMIRLFLRWLAEIFKIEKKDIRLRVGINNSHRDRIKDIQDYWSRITSIPKTQFQQPYYQISKQLKVYPDRKSYFGVLRIRVNSHNDKFWKILGMIEGMKKTAYN